MMRSVEYCLLLLLLQIAWDLDVILYIMWRIGDVAVINRRFKTIWLEGDNNSLKALSLSSVDARDFSNPEGATSLCHRCLILHSMYGSFCCYCMSSGGCSIAWWQRWRPTGAEIETSWTFHLKLSNHVELQLQSKQKLSRHESYVFAYKVSKKLSKSWQIANQRK
jgi:hypothetical protein